MTPDAPTPPAPEEMAMTMPDDYEPMPTAKDGLEAEVARLTRENERLTARIDTYMAEDVEGIAEGERLIDRAERAEAEVVRLQREVEFLTARAELAERGYGVLEQQVARLQKRVEDYAALTGGIADNVALDRCKDGHEGAIIGGVGPRSYCAACLMTHFLAVCDERDALQARGEELEAENDRLSAELVREQDGGLVFFAENCNLRERAEGLAAAIRDHPFTVGGDDDHMRQHFLALLAQPEARPAGVPLEITLTREEILGRIEVGAQRRCGLSAVELIQRYRAGTLEDTCGLIDVLALVDLLDEDDPGIVAQAGAPQAGGREISEALERVRIQLNHYVGCPVPDGTCTCHHFADLDTIAAQLARRPPEGEAGDHAECVARERALLAHAKRAGHSGECTTQRLFRCRECSCGWSALLAPAAGGAAGERKETDG